jgi:hypothetical protein
MSLIINPFPAIPQLLNEQFEGPGATGWTSVTTTPFIAWNDQYATAPISGNYSARITANMNAYKDIPATSKCYVRFRFYWSAPVSSATGVLLSLRGANSNAVSSLSLQGTSNRFMAAISGIPIAVSTAAAADTLLYGWLEFDKTSVSTTTLRVGWSTTASRPIWPANGVSGPLIVRNQGIASNDATRVQFGAIGAFTNYNVTIDDVQIQTIPFA